MEAVRSFETSVNFKHIAWFHIPEDGDLHSRLCENLKYTKSITNVLFQIIIDIDTLCRCKYI
jgi:hypothetical protein